MEKWFAFKLTRSVKNPGRTDRRNKYDWRLREEFAEGTVFLATKEQYSSNTSGNSPIHYLNITKGSDSYPLAHEVRYYYDPSVQKRALGSPDNTAGLAAALLAASEPVPDTVYLWSKAECLNIWSLASVLQLLVDDGKLSLADLDVLLQRTREGKKDNVLMGEQRGVDDH